MEYMILTSRTIINTFNQMVCSTYAYVCLTNSICHYSIYYAPHVCHFLRTYTLSSQTEYTKL
nr:MAG TPA: hypothetical protein [Caudoviricetes sp.]